MLTMSVSVEHLPMRRPFAITGYVFDSMPAVVVTLSDGLHAGRGEAAGVYYLDDGVEAMTGMLDSVRADVEAGLSREALQTRLPAGGARNALDCAMWDLEAARRGTPVWKLAGLPSCRPLVTTMTAGAGTPEAMADIARGFDGARAIKLKLTGEVDLDLARVRAVRAACADVWLGVDANQGYSLNSLRSALPAFERSDVRLVEQPLPRGDEALLEGFKSPIPLAADESLLTIGDFDRVAGRFDVANIKLDKSGGLTEALAMAHRAKALGLGVMVGNMAGSSWAMAAAFVVGQLCDIVDLDGPLALRGDRSPGVEYINGEIVCGDSVWGRGIAPP